MRELVHSAIRILIGLLFITVGAAAHAADLAPGDYYIVNKSSQKALTAFNEKNGADIVGQSAPKPGSNAAQVWTLSRTRDGSGYSIRSKLNGAYLTTGDENDNGDTSVVVESAANKAPSWRLHPFQNSYGVESGNSGLTLNITGDSSDDHAAIIVYEAGTDDNRQWLLYPASNTRHSPIHVSETSRFDNRSKQYKIAPLPSAALESERTRRFKVLDYQPSGLYVKKGEAVSVTVAGLATSPDGLMILVGPRNSFYDEDSKNDPQFVWAGKGRTDFTAKRSGLIYFQYIDSGFNAHELPAIDVAIVRGGSSIPFYIEGQTSFDEWRSMLAADAATPFVEMMNNDALITVTRKSYMKEPIADPSQILDLVAKIIGWHSEISGFDGSSEVNQPTPLRIHYLQDTFSSSAEFRDGVYMYATDYMIGIPAGSLPDMLDPQKLRKAWSMWHETGHTFQQRDWTWEDVWETTVNIYSLNAQRHLGDPSRLAERDPDTGRTVLDNAARYLARKARAFDNGAQMRAGEDDEGEVWVRLVMFDQLRQAFGSNFYQRLHKDYREHPLKTRGDEDDKALKSLQIQTFILRASRIANQDLTKFFMDWGLPITKESASELKHLNLAAADPELSRIGLVKRQGGKADPIKTTVPLSAAAPAERRCGWYSSPTPGNLLLTDKDGDWWIQMQGRPDPNGIDNVPAFDDRQFVDTNVPGSGHGYGCACMIVETNAKQQRITRVISGEILPLVRCRNDRSLPNPDG